MCGIAAHFAHSSAASPVDEAELLRMRDQMTARGPDGAGLWLSNDRRVGLAYRRLSIIDLSAAGVQPMSSKDGRLVIVFNGEIYNHRELRSGLEARGRRFRSNSDTEVLLHLYAEQGRARMGTRLESAARIFTDLKFVDFDDHAQMQALDLRLNQNYFVGLAAERINQGIVAYTKGRSLSDGLIELVPSAM